MSETINCLNCAIGKFKYELCENCDGMKFLGTSDNVEDMIANYPRWIPCSEHYPDFNKYVLVTLNSDYWYEVQIMALCLDTDQYHDTYVVWRTQEESIEYDMEDVIAWMPLPYHYQEDRV